MSVNVSPLTRTHNAGDTPEDWKGMRRELILAMMYLQCNEATMMQSLDLCLLLVGIPISDHSSLKEIPVKLFLDHSRLQTSLEDLEITNHVTRTLLK